MGEADVRTRVRRRRHRGVAWAALTAALVAAIAGAVVVVALRGDDQGAAPKSKGPATTRVVPVTNGPNVSTAVGTAPFRAAYTNGSDINVFSAPDAGTAPLETLSALTSYALPRTLLAFDQWHEWLHVYLPSRPNNSTAWVKTTDVLVSNPLEYHIRVSLADHHLWLLHNGAVEFETGVAIGTSQYPTPTGTFYVTDPIDLHDRPNLGYGVFAIGLSGHSDVLTEFGGGDGQIAIHGTNNPGDIGRDVSHGCVRVTNDAIERLSSLPLGTPVTIV